jgi:hypothetical protein
MDKVIIHIEVEDCIQDCPFAQLGHETKNNTTYYKWFCNRLSSEYDEISFLINDGLPFVLPTMVTPPSKCPYRSASPCGLI